MKERFIRSALRVKHASKYAGEQTYADASPRQVPQNPMSWNWNEDRLLLLSTDYTNVNVWGSAAIAGGYIYTIIASRWLILLSPFILPLRFIHLAASIAWKKLQVSFLLLCFWLYTLASLGRKFLGRIGKLRNHQFNATNILPMDSRTHLRTMTNLIIHPPWSDPKDRVYGHGIRHRECR